MLSGTLTHEDSMGNRKEIRQGEVQYMSAGTGVVHSEMNLGQEEVHLYQIWFMPKSRGLAPAYDQKDFGEIKKNTLVPVVSDGIHASHSSIEDQAEGVIIFQADATIYLGIFDEGYTTVYEQKKGRGVFVYVTEGLLSINGTTFAAGDQARIEDETVLTLTAQESARFILIDVGM
jgi:redox-sensitive bicupin YhaK (pirin superfamily)